MKQEVVDSQGLVKITSVGSTDGCRYHVEFPKLGIPSLDHWYYKTPLEQGGAMGLSDCNHQGTISLGIEIVKHLRKYIDWLGKSSHVQKYVFALIINSLEELLGNNAILWNVQGFELLNNLK